MQLAIMEIAPVAPLRKHFILENQYIEYSMQQYLSRVQLHLSN